MSSNQTTQDLMKDLVFEINKVAVKLGKHAHELTKAEFVSECDKFNENTFRKVGGFSQVVKACLPSKNSTLGQTQSTKLHKAYVKKLEKLLGTREAFQEQLIQSVSDLLSEKSLTVNTLDGRVTRNYLDTLLKKNLSNTGEKDARSICTIWSDQHFGTNVNAEEMAHKNEFNWVIGARRLGFLCEQLATYKIEKRETHQELVVFLLGDNIGGIIHNQEGPDFDLLVHQINGTLYYYTQALHYLKQFFPKIRVVCQPGNHGRVMHKASKDRALNQKYDSLENIIFYSLSLLFATEPKVTIDVTKAPYSDALVQNHRIYATHGDTVFTTGNVGSTVPIHKIEQQINKINADELSHGSKPFEMFCTGHVHHPLFTQVGSGVKVAVNGCLIGSDSFALGIGIHSSNPVQVLWETTKKFVQGDSRFIYVNGADQDTRYNKVILPYKYELSATSI